VAAAESIREPKDRIFGRVDVQEDKNREWMPSAVGKGPTAGEVLDGFLTIARHL
jgi:hypothetical protein